jgi:hypothetical protein
MTTRLKMTCILDGRWYVSDPFSSLVMWGTHNELPGASIEDFFFAQEELYSNLSDLLL